MAASTELHLFIFLLLLLLPLHLPPSPPPPPPPPPLLCTGNKSITLDDVLIKACSLALLSVPTVNSSYTSDSTFTPLSNIHVSIVSAEQTELDVRPVIASPQNLQVSQIAELRKVSVCVCVCVCVK